MRGAHAYLRGSADLRLHYRCWDVASARAVVVICPGLGEHSGRYEELANDFARAGLSTYALDHRGNGRSDGRRGHVRRFNQYVHDLEKFRRRVIGAVGADLPLVFLGHSLGGLILIRYLQEYPGVQARGAVLSAPLLGFAVDVPRWKERLAKALLYISPALPLSTGVDPAILSHDSQIVAAYRRDSLVHDRITPRLYSEIQRAISEVEEKVRQVRVPLLLLIPAQDQLVRPDLMQRFAASVGEPKRVVVKTYAGLYHEVLNERNRSSTITDVLGWIERHIASRSLASEGASEFSER